MKTPTDSTPVRSASHLCFCDGEEWLLIQTPQSHPLLEDRNIHRAPLSNVIDVITGNRHCRWECGLAHLRRYSHTYPRVVAIAALAL